MSFHECIVKLCIVITFSYKKHITSDMGGGGELEV